MQEPLLTVPFLILQKTEGANDGLVSIRSARWGTFAGVWHGMSHYDEVDLEQISLFDTVTDADVLEELKNVEVSTMTPLDALNTLYRLQNKLKNRW